MSLITSVRVEPGPSHDVVHVWNRGGHAGSLCVTAGDGLLLAQRLVPHGTDELDASGRFTRRAFEASL